MFYYYNSLVRIDFYCWQYVKVAFIWFHWSVEILFEIKCIMVTKYVIILLKKNLCFRLLAFVSFCLEDHFWKLLDRIGFYVIFFPFLNQRNLLHRLFFKRLSSEVSIANTWLAVAVTLKAQNGYGVHSFCSYSRVGICRPFVKASSFLTHVRTSTGYKAMWHFNFVLMRYSSYWFIFKRVL